MKRSTVLVLCVMAVSGCVVTKATQIPGRFDPAAGRYEMIKYSPSIEGEAVLVKDTVKVLLYGEISTRLIPGQKENKSLLKTIDPADLKYLAEIDVYIHNLTERNIPFRLEIVRFNDADYYQGPREIVLIPNSVERITLTDVVVGNFDTAFDVAVIYAFGGKHRIQNIKLKRLTAGEYKQQKKGILIFGPW